MTDNDNNDSDDDKRITGVMVQYYVACKTELWYFANYVEYNEEDENIRKGRLIHEESFKKEKKNIGIDNTISTKIGLKPILGTEKGRKWIGQNTVRN